MKYGYSIGFDIIPQSLRVHNSLNLQYLTVQPNLVINVIKKGVYEERIAHSFRSGILSVSSQGTNPKSILPT